MKAGMEMSTLVQTVYREVELMRDLIVPARQLTYTTVGDAKEGMLTVHDIGGGAPSMYPMNSHARGQLREICGIPAVYFEQCRKLQPALLDRNVNTWLEAKPGSEHQMVRTTSGTVRAVLSDKYRRVDNWEILKYLWPTIEELMNTHGLRIESCNLSGERMYIKLVSDRITAEVQKDDVVQWGSVISNSEVGAGCLAIVPWVLRLRCTNGMVLPDEGVRRHHIGRKASSDASYCETVLSAETVRADNHALLLKARDLLVHSLSEAKMAQFAKRVKEIIGMKIEPTADPAVAVKVLANRFNLTEEDRSGIFARFLGEPDMTAWGLVNAVTAQAKFVADYDHATELETIGGRMMQMTPAEWRPVLTAK